MNNIKHIHNIFKINIFIGCVFLIVNSNHATENSWERFNTGLTGGNIQTIIIDPNDPNTVYVGTLGGGFYWSNDIINNPYWEMINNSLFNWSIFSLMVKNSTIYAGTKQGLFYLDLNNKANGWIPYDNPEIDLTNYTILELRNCTDPNYQKSFYIVGYNNISLQKELFIIEDDETVDTVRFKILNTNVYDVAPYRQDNHQTYDKLGRMYVATDNGLYKFNDYRHSPQDSSRLLPDQEIICLAERYFKRAENNYAFAIYAGRTLLGGKFYEAEPHDRDFLKNKYITNLDPWFSDKLPSSDNHAITKIYAITKDDSIFSNVGIFDDWPAIPLNGLPHVSMNILATHDNRIDNPILGTNDGIYFINNSSWESKNFESLHAHRIHVIIHDTTKISHSQRYRNYLWAGTDGVLFHRDLKTDTKWDRDSVYIFITDIEIHPDCEYLYLATKGHGVFRKKKDSDSADPFPRGGLSNYHITDLAFDKQKKPNMYAGTGNGKIFKWNYSQNKWIPIVYLSSEIITQIAIDSTKIQSGNILYFCTDKEIYQVNSKSPYPGTPPYWNAQANVHSLVFNNQDSVLFAGKSDGIWYHPIESVIENDWNEYEHLSLTDKNVQQLHIIPTDPSFNGVLYAMTSDSVSRVSQLWRNVIGENIIESTVDETSDFERQYGESFCVNLKNPNKVYMGTGGTGVYQYLYDQGETPYVRPGPIDFGNIPQKTEKSDTITFKNNNSFSPLIVLLQLEDTTNFRLDTPDSIVVFPGIAKICSVTFNPQLNEEFRSNLKIEWRDIFFNPVMQGAQTIELSGTGKGGDFIINGKADSIFNFTLKTHVDCTVTKILKWKKEGNITITNFDVNGPNDSHYIKIPTNWEDEFNNNDSGEVSIKFSPIERDTIPGSIAIEYDCENNSTVLRRKKIN